VTRPNPTEYLAEAAGTAVNLFVGLSAMSLDFGHGQWLPRHVTSHSLRLLMTGTVYAGSGSLWALTPPGKRSGAHINPSVTLAFALHGKMKPADVVGYVVGQFAGAIVAAYVATAVWRNALRSIQYGMTLPGAGYTAAHAAVAEVVMTGLLVLTILTCVSHERLARRTPLAVWVLVAVEVWLGAPISGTSLNPARSFGPSLVAMTFADQWIYWVGPTVGAAAAVGLFAIATDRRALTAKLFHAVDYRSIFRRERLPQVGRPAI
jgi:aquaporin Z